MKKVFYLFIVASLIFVGCQKEPSAKFTASKMSANVNEAIMFTNSSTDGDSFEWEFGDGQTSKAENPSHSYTTEGTFSVKMTVFSKNGKKSDDATASITISELEPVAAFSFTGAGGNAPCIVTFTNSSLNSTSYSWDFGDGGTSTGENPQHTFTTGGTFTVQLTATGAGGTNSISKTVNVSNPTGPIASFTYTGAGNFAPCLVTFTNTSQNSTSYSWNFGDGSTSTTANPTHTYTSGGTFTVQLTATGAGGTNSTSQTVNILNPPTKVTINQLSLLDYPQVNGSGSNWDFSAGPDIYWVIMNEAQTSTYFTGGTITDAVYGNLPFSYSNGLPFTITNLSLTYTILFYDDDTPDADDYMGGYYFTPSNYTNYSSTLNFWSSTSDFEFDLSVTWANSKSLSNQSNDKQRIELIPIDKSLITLRKK